MSKELTDVSDRCGSCKFFMYRVINDTLKKWGGICTKPNRKTYHDRSQKACKLYEPYNDTESRKELEELDIKVEEDIPTVQAVKKGHWIHKNDDVFDWFECSECGYGDECEVNYGCGMKYCPNCGARMVDDNNDR